MFGVMTTHVLQACYPSLHAADFSLINSFRVLLMCMSIVAVNCYVMISGYFRIKQSWRGFLNLYTQCAFYMIILTTLATLFLNASAVDILKKTVFALTESGYWFLTAYLALFLVAPVLNVAFEKQNSKQRKASLMGLLLIDVYIGYIHQSPEISQDGYSAIHFFF